MLKRLLNSLKEAFASSHASSRIESIGEARTPATITNAGDINARANHGGGFAIHTDPEPSDASPGHIAYWNEVDRILQLKRDQRLEEAERLLLTCVEATERAANDWKIQHGTSPGVAPWYYEQLAIIYAKQRRFHDEVAILRRYEGQPKARGSGPARLRARLVKAEARLAKYNALDSARNATG